MIWSPAWRSLLKHIDGMTQGQRWRMLAATLGLLAGIELVLVIPMHHKRLALTELAAMTVQQAEHQQRARAQAQQQQEEALTQRLQAANDALRALGVNADLMGTRGEPLSFLLSHTLRDSAVQVVSLRALDAETVNLTRPANDPAEVTPPQVLFRHRYVLTLQGEVNSVTQALDPLQKALKPLRLERLKLQGRPDGSVLTTLHWGTMGLEKSWLSL